MRDYYVTGQVWGAAIGTVERFADHKAAPMVAAGLLQAYDKMNKKHLEARQRQEREAEERRIAQEALLREERERPDLAVERIRKQRRTHVARQVEEQKAEILARRRRDEETERAAKRLRAEEAAATSAVR